MKKALLLAVLIIIGANMAKAQDIVQKRFVGYCNASMKAFVPIIGDLQDLKEMPVNSLGFKPFFATGSKMLGAGLVDDDGDYCLLWTRPREGELG